MTKKIVSLSVEDQVYNKYKNICEKKGWILSRQFENFMVEEIKREGTKND